MNSHPAIQIPFAELHAALRAEVAAGNLQAQTGRAEHAGLEIYTYTRQCYYGKLWNPTTTLARGLVLAPAEQRIVALPFVKFFNYGELGAPVPHLAMEASVKMDGSLGIAFHWGGEWHVATKGRLDSPQAQWAERTLRTLHTGALDPEVTWLFEIIFDDPQSDTVIHYDFEGLILLSGYHRGTGMEVARAQRSETARALGVAPVAVIDGADIPGLLAQARELDEHHEGFVVRFANGHRLKIKGNRYCELARLIMNLEPLPIWEMLLQGHDLETARVRLPEELQRDFDAMAALLRRAEATALAELEALAASVAHLSDAELGRQQGVLLAGRRTGKFVYPWRKGAFAKSYPLPGDPLRRKVFDLFRPAGNILPGYTPSDVVTRFLNAER